MSSLEPESEKRHVNLFTEADLDREFNFLLRIINVFGSRHGFSVRDSIETINNIRCDILKAVGGHPAHKNAYKFWSVEDEEELLLEFRRGYPFNKKLETKFGRSMSALEQKLSNLKHHAIVRNYDLIIEWLADHLHDENSDICPEWVKQCADDIWSHCADGFIKTKVNKFREIDNNQGEE